MDKNQDRDEIVTATLNRLSGAKTSQFEQYQFVYKEYSKDGQIKTAVFWHSGYFYNFLGLDDIENGTSANNFHDIVKLCNLNITRNRPSKPLSLFNPLKAGMPLESAGRFQQLLLDEGYVLVMVSQSQNDKKIRHVHHLLSPATQLPELTTSLANYMVAIYIENSTTRKEIFKIDRMFFRIGLCAIDISTSKVIVHEAISTANYEAQALEDAYRFLNATSASEIVVSARNFKNLSPKQLGLPPFGFFIVKKNLTAKTR